MFARCDVLKWEDQVALFDLALSSFGSVDIVVRSESIHHSEQQLTFTQCAIAGLTEIGQTAQGSLVFENGKPLPPTLKTLQVNLIGVFYSQCCRSQVIMFFTYVVL